MPSPTVAVVVCAYTLERWDALRAAVTSAAGQSPAPDELLLVIDHNELLLERARRELVALVPGLEVVPNARKQGLSGARNTAVERVRSDVVVFLDDDATATPGWLAALLRHYDDPAVLGVGGAAAPQWPTGTGRPDTLPAPTADARGELDWVVGCTYEGQPRVATGVRNLMGCNMSLRRSVFAAVGGFDENLGRIGKTPLGCEETELCIRAHQRFGGARIVFDPEALVLHHVSADRRSWSYLWRRSYAEGLSKAAVSRLVGAGDGLSTERDYASRVLPRAVVRGVASAVRPGRAGRRSSLLGSAAVVSAFGATAVGYARGRLARDIEGRVHAEPVRVSDAGPVPGQATG